MHQPLKASDATKARMEDETTASSATPGRSASGSSSTSSTCCSSTSGNVFVSRETTLAEASLRFHADFLLRPTVLGEGGTCKVRAATCRRTGKSVAVKSFRRKDVDAHCWQIAKNECQCLPSLHHPNIVRLDRSYASDEAVHLVLEHLPGGDLFDRILANKGLDESGAARVAVQLLRALGYLHAQGLMHRDLKPENVMFTGKGSHGVKLIDFGLSIPWRQQKEALGCDGMWHQYAAPEVCSNASYDWRADMWSLGALLYTTMSAQFLYSGEGEEVAKKCRRGNVDYCRAFGSLSKSSQDFVTSFLVTNPAKRATVLKALSHPWLQKHAPVEAAAALAEVAPLAAVLEPAPRKASIPSCFLGIAALCNRA